MERLDKVRALSEGSFSMEANSDDSTTSVVERVLAIYYPALAVERVPSVLPHKRDHRRRAFHTSSAALPLPGKGYLPSDSEMVRKYSGMKVASTEEYEHCLWLRRGAYVDFGLPGCSSLR